MKNLLKNRKGFTLAEVLLVVAIVVILSGATIIGVASWVNSAEATANKAKQNSANFEADAVLEVDKKKGYVPSAVGETTALETGDTEAGNNGNNGGNENNGGNNGGNENGGTISGGNGNGNGDATEASESSEEAGETTAAETTKSQQGGGTTDSQTSPFSMTSTGSKTIAADPSKKLKQVVIEWENNNKESWGTAHSQFVVTYNNSQGGNYNNKNNTIGGQSDSKTETIDVDVEGCSGINITYTSGKFTIKSIKYIYE